MSIVTSKVSDLLAPKSEQPKSKDIGSKEEFLTLLVTQLKNQNPLDPTDPSDFSAQLAQFSSLEQLLNINTNLEKSLNENATLNQLLNSSVAANLIGKNVSATGNAIKHISGDTENINLMLEKDAKYVNVEIKDANGTVIRSIVKENLEKGENFVEWDGKDMNGVPASSGDYTINVTAKDIQDNNVNAIQYVMGRVEGVRFVDGQAYLVINGKEVSISELNEVFE
jgi:flagellar basal-body rod modification protein FlgD